MLIGVKEYVKSKSNSVSYTGRFGGKQDFVLDPIDTDTESYLEQGPNATPFKSLEALPFFTWSTQSTLWDQAFVEGVVIVMLFYSTIILSNSLFLDVKPLLVPSSSSGILGTINWVDL